MAVIRRRIPGADQRLVSEVARAAQRLRRMDLVKPPGLAESIDWAAALATLGAARARP